MAIDPDAASTRIYDDQLSRATDFFVQDLRRIYMLYKLGQYREAHAVLVSGRNALDAFLKRSSGLLTNRCNKHVYFGLKKLKVYYKCFDFVLCLSLGTFPDLQLTLQSLLKKLDKCQHVAAPRAEHLFKQIVLKFSISSYYCFVFDIERAIQIQREILGLVTRVADAPAEDGAHKTILQQLGRSQFSCSNRRSTLPDQASPSRKLRIQLREMPIDEQQEFEDPAGLTLREGSEEEMAEESVCEGGPVWRGSGSALGSVGAQEPRSAAFGYQDEIPNLVEQVIDLQCLYTEVHLHQLELKSNIKKYMVEAYFRIKKAQKEILSQYGENSLYFGVACKIEVKIGLNIMNHDLFYDLQNGLMSQEIGQLHHLNSIQTRVEDRMNEATPRNLAHISSYHNYAQTPSSDKDEEQSPGQEHGKSAFSSKVTSAEQFNQKTFSKDLHNLVATARRILMQMLVNEKRKVNYSCHIHIAECLILQSELALLNKQFIQSKQNMEEAEQIVKRIYGQSQHPVVAQFYVNIANLYKIQNSMLLENCVIIVLLNPARFSPENKELVIKLILLYEQEILHTIDSFRGHGFQEFLLRNLNQQIKAIRDRRPHDKEQYFAFSALIADNFRKLFLYKKSCLQQITDFDHKARSAQALVEIFEQAQAEIQCYLQLLSGKNIEDICVEESPVKQYYRKAFQMSKSIWRPAVNPQIESKQQSQALVTEYFLLQTISQQYDQIINEDDSFQHYKQLPRIKAEQQLND